MHGKVNDSVLQIENLQDGKIESIQVSDILPISGLLHHM